MACRRAEDKTAVITGGRGVYVEQLAHDRKRRIQRRLAPREWPAQEEPMLRATNVHYDVADRTRAMDHGGIGAIHLMCLLPAAGLEPLAGGAAADGRRDARPPSGVEALAETLGYGGPGPLRPTLRGERKRP